jgi:hypothetical protein
MKKLDISNYADLKDYQIQNWVIYSVQETNTDYLFKLKCIDGNTTHVAVGLGREIKDGKVEVSIMYRSYTNIIWKGQLPLSQFKDKEQFWLMIECYIQSEHKK